MGTMRYRYARQFKLKMIQCGISEFEIMEILNRRVDRAIIPSQSNPLVVLMMGVVNQKRIGIIIHTKTQILITIRTDQKRIGSYGRRHQTWHQALSMIKNWIMTKN